MCFVDPRPPLLPEAKPRATMAVEHAVNMTLCGPAHDTVLTNRQTEKLNFDTSYITRCIIIGGI